MEQLRRARHVGAGRDDAMHGDGGMPALTVVCKWWSRKAPYFPFIRKSKEGPEMNTPRRRIAVVIATLTLAGLTTACGAIGNAVDCNQVGQEITKITTELQGSLASAGTDPKAFEKASQEAAGKLKTLAGNYDGDLAGAINDMAAVFDGIKMDNPSGVTASMSKISSAQTKIQSACG
ncbi:MULTISPECIES: hypothetical protein [unclassified Nonomuraea]|uniref:hypothetical protein n=1 Tax=unclassified Nonomuraea TaxID=2593643 RepID=UPI003411700D